MDQTASVKNLEQWIEELDQFNQTPGNGTTRPVFTAEDMAARSYVHKLMESVGLEVKEDNAGNLFGVLPGEDPSLEPVWTGSHIDTVPNGGKYDGIAGVFAGIEALRMIKESGAPHKRSLSANVYSGEEMSRFGVCCIGSRAIAGRLHLEDLKSHSDPSGTSLYQALKDVGYDPDSFDEEFPCKTPVYASLELHIEQNDVLEKSNYPVGAVTGICAPTNMVVEVFGVQSHAGGTSMTARRDAYMAAAEISLLLERLALESDSMYITGTVGEMTLEPNAANVIPGHATFSVDIRSVTIEDKDALLEKFYSGIKEIEEGVAFRHDHAFDPLGLGVDETLDSVGFHYLRSGRDKEDHMYSPETIVTLQRAVREDSYERFRAYTDLVDDAGRPHTLRGLLEFVPAGDPVPLEEVEPAAEIVRHFKTGAMSYGSLSAEAHETLAVAMNSIGARSNTGEGGELRERFGTEKNSKIKQVASGRFGVTSEYLCSAEEIQIKMAQGAKPGEGGHLPGKKVYPWVAETRFSTPGVALISPPPHHDIYSIEDLAQLIYDLKSANRDARINVKLVSEAGVGTIASGVAKAGAQVILISGYDGGTGAAPGSSIHNAGLPWELGLTEAHRCLTENGLRDRVVLETDGKLMSGRDVAIASLLGAEEFGFATAPLVCLGCMMMRVCSKDTCPVGIATQNKTLRSCFKGKPEYVSRFMFFIAEQVREIMAGLGFRSMAEMTGRSDCLRVRKELTTDRAFKVDMRQILGDHPMPVLSREDLESGNYGLYAPKNLYDFELEKTPDMAVLLPAFEEGLRERTSDGKTTSGAICTSDGKTTSGAICTSSGKTTSGKTTSGVICSLKVSSTDRAFGTILGSEVTKRFGNSLAEDTFVIRAEGGGGQSFGAFLPKGVTIRLTGDANDGFGKGLSGGKLVLVPDPKSKFEASQNIIVGNVALYGATGGKAYINGIAGERFCVRNSGAVAVAEGCGDHGLEYMTGGRAVILGRTGKNFAAGMSGGIAYVLDRDHSLYRRINKDMVSLQELTEKYDIAELCDILTEYTQETGSKLGQQILDDFEAYIPFFKKIVPMDYQRMLTAIGRYEEQGIPQDKAVLEAFREITEG